MRIKSKVIALIIGLFVALSIAQYAVQRLILMPSFTALEQQNARTDMTRVIHAVSRELNDLGESAAGFGNWADSYQYMGDHNAAFAVNNLHLGSAIAANIDVLVLMDTSGKFVWTAGLKPGTATSGDTAERMPIDFVTAGSLPTSHRWYPALQSGSVVNGLINTDKGVLLAAMTPVLNGRREGPHRGAVIFARFLTDAEVAKLGRQAEIALSVHERISPADGALPGRQDLLVTEPDATHVYHTFGDVNGVPVVTLRSSSVRSISARGYTTSVYATLFLLGGGALVLGLLVWALNRSVIAPLNTLTRYAVSIGEKGAQAVPLSFARSDELGILAAEINQMLDRLGRAQREIVDRSFEAGVAEMASGTLHNVGNAMTPLSVHTSALLHRLQNAPTGDVELAASELARGVADPERLADLVSFLRLTSTSLIETIREAEKDLGTIQRQALAVQEALATQRAFTGGGHSTESVSLEHAVQRSIEIVPPRLRAALDIEVHPSLIAVGSVRTSRTILQQILQNLIVNSAEAVLGTGKSRGRLRLSASLDKEGAALLLRVDDDGPGIARDSLERVFARGYSTKSALTNSGIGLHWCANALAALGGKIRVLESGFGQGACFELRLPLDRRQTPPISEAA